MIPLKRVVTLAVLFAAVGHPVAAETEARDGGLFIDDSPVFPFGFWWSERHEIDAAAELGFNIVYPLDSDDIPYAAEKGLFVVGDGRRRRHTDQSALVGWFMRDDASRPDHLTDLRKRVREVRSNDPRPTIVSCNSRDPLVDRDFAEAADIYVPYEYPFPRFDIDRYERTLTALCDGVGAKVMWTTVQSSGMYSKHRPFGFDDRQMMRMLDPAQLRLIVWTAIRSGARGILLWPANGVVVPGGWNESRAHEAAILAAEVAVLGATLIESTDSDHAVRSEDSEVRATLRSLDDSSLLLLTRAAPGSEYAVDGRRETIELVVDGHAGAKAHRITFPEIVELETRDEGSALHVTIPDLGVDAAVLISRDDDRLSQLRIAVDASREPVARHAVALAEAYAVEATRVLDHLVRLDAVPASVPANWRSAVPPLERSGDAARRHESAMSVVDAYRTLLFDCRTHADRHLHHADPEAVAFRMSAFTLPEFFSSFDAVAAGAKR